MYIPQESSRKHWKNNLSLDDSKSQTKTNKHNSVLRSFARPQADGKLKNNRREFQKINEH